MSQKGSKKTTKTAKASRDLPMVWSAAILANVLVLAIIVFAGALESTDFDLYYQTVQEDEYLEWATFWAFMIAAGVGLVGAARQRRVTGQFPWFFLGVSLFCFAVAMEEISWGQRVLGYRPPIYFLEHNFQQELNVHNVVSTSLRKLALKSVIAGYGIVLPLIALAIPIRRLLTRFAVVAPPVKLVPAFVATYALYEIYPWKYTGEVVELALGACFLFAALEAARAFSESPPRTGWRCLAPLAIAFVVVFGLGLANAAVSRSQRSAHPDNIAAAQSESEAMKQDFLAMAQSRGDKWATKCTLHKRVYSYVQKYKRGELFEGEFAQLKNQGLPEARADFFIDPWNSPYWIRCSKDKKRRIIFVYSFGPNRSRDSNRWEILGDDIGTVIQTRE